MNDQIHSKNDLRIEIAPNGATKPVAHESLAELTADLADFLRVAKKSVATVGSAGGNTGDHSMPKELQILVPMPTRCRIVSGATLFHVQGQAIATSDSQVELPDIACPIKSGVIEVRQQFFFVSGKAVVRGR